MKADLFDEGREFTLTQLAELFAAKRQKLWARIVRENVPVYVQRTGPGNEIILNGGQALLMAVHEMISRLVCHATLSANSTEKIFQVAMRALDGTELPCVYFIKNCNGDWDASDPCMSNGSAYLMVDVGRIARELDDPEKWFSRAYPLWGKRK